MKLIPHILGPGEDVLLVGRIGRPRNTLITDDCDVSVAQLHGSLQQQWLELYLDLLLVQKPNCQHCPL